MHIRKGPVQTTPKHTKQTPRKQRNTPDHSGRRPGIQPPRLKATPTARHQSANIHTQGPSRGKTKRAKPKGSMKDHPMKTSNPPTQEGRDQQPRSHHWERQATIPPKWATPPNQGNQRTATTGPTTRTCGGPPHQSQKQASATAPKRQPAGSAGDYTKHTSDRP